MLLKGGLRWTAFRSWALTAPLRARAGHAVGAHRLGDVLQGLGAEIIEADLELAFDVIEGGGGYEDAARFRDGFQARRDVDAIAIEITALDHHVAEIDADAQDDVAVIRQPGLAAAMAFCRSTAHCTALTALANSTSTPSPVTLKMRPCAWRPAAAGLPCAVP